MLPLKVTQAGEDCSVAAVAGAGFEVGQLAVAVGDA